MKIISRHIRMSAFSLVMPAIFHAYSSSAYASLLDISQSQAYGSEPTALGAVISDQEPVISSYQTASVYFITDGRKGPGFNGGSSQSMQNFTTEGLCASAGYRIKTCPDGYIRGETCPDDKQYVRECINPESWCKSNGYTVTECELPNYPNEVCPHSGAYYRSCQTDNVRACREADYSLSCEIGKLGDDARICPYDSSYKKCICNPCQGYDYTAEQATAQGYIPGEACNSCGSIKYKRTANACDGFKECTNGGTIGADVCYSGSVKKFSECDDGCSPEYKYNSSNCNGIYEYFFSTVQGYNCNNKYLYCAKAYPILYSDGSVADGIISGKTPIGVVFKSGQAIALKNLKWNSANNTTVSCTYLSCHSDWASAQSAVAQYQPTGCNLNFCSRGRWQLPDLEELKNIAYYHFLRIQASLIMLKNFNAQKIDDNEYSGYYWSRTEASSDTAYVCGMEQNSGGQNTCRKVSKSGYEISKYELFNGGYGVRPILSF